MGLIKLAGLLIKTPFKVYCVLAGLGAQSRKDMLHMSVRLFFAPWARPANQGIVHLICSNKGRRLWKAPDSNKASSLNLVIKCIGKVVCILQALGLSKLLVLLNKDSV